MRVRLLRNVRMAGATAVELLAGTVVNAMPEVAEKWISQGVAMLDKSVEPQEVKTEIPKGRIEPPEPWPRSKPKTTKRRQ